MKLTMAQVDKLLDCKQDNATGFLVSFEYRNNGILESGYYPSDAPFLTENAAWDHAKLFAMYAPSAYVNIYVVNCVTYVPVAGYDAMKLRRHR